MISAETLITISDIISNNINDNIYINNEILKLTNNETLIEIVLKKLNDLYPIIENSKVVDLQLFKLIYTLIEIVWFIGIENYISKHIIMPNDISVKTLLISNRSLIKLNELCYDHNIHDNEIFKYFIILYNFITNKLLSGLLIEIFIKRLIIVLIVLKHNATTIHLPILPQITNYIELLSCDKYKAYVLFELRVSANGPQWLKYEANTLFSNLIYSNNGLYYAMKGYLEGMTDRNDFDKIQMNFVKLITSKPSNQSMQSYIRHLCPQIIDLFISLNDIAYIKTLVMIVNRVAHTSTSICKDEIIFPLLAPVIRLCNSKYLLNKNVYSSMSNGLVSHDVILKSIHILYYLLTSYPVLSPLLTVLSTNEIAKSIIYLYIYLSNLPDSDVSNKCKELTIRYINITNVITSDLLVDILVNKPDSVITVSNNLLEIVKCIDSYDIDISDILSYKRNTVSNQIDSSLDSESVDIDIDIDKLIKESNNKLSKYLLNITNYLNIITPMILNTNKHIYLSNLFIDSLQYNMLSDNLHSAIDGLAVDEIRACYSVIVITLLAVVPMDILMSNGDKILSILSLFLKKHIKLLNDLSNREDINNKHILIQEVNTNDDTNNNINDKYEDSSLDIVFNIISSITLYGCKNRVDNEEKLLIDIMNDFQQISLLDNKRSIIAYDLALAILTRNSQITIDPLVNLSTNQIDECINKYNVHLNDVNPAIKAYGIRCLINEFKQSRQLVNKNTYSVIIDLIMPLANDIDSFVYLGVIQLLKLLAQIQVDIINLYIDIYFNHSSTYDIKQRTVISEVLVILFHNSITSNPTIISTIINKSINEMKYLYKLIKESYSHIDSLEFNQLVNLQTMKIDKIDNNSIDNYLRLSEAILLRQSVMSLLAEVVKCSDWDVSKYIINLLDISIGILSMEIKDNQIDKSARRSAVFLITHLITSFHDKFIHLSEGGTYLKLCYNTFKRTINDNDEVVKYQSNIGLNVIDNIMYDFITISDSKPKILEVKILRKL